MKYSISFYLFSLMQLILLINVTDGDEFFKVPLEVREKNRPERLVDNVNDPDMIKLKNLQDKFFDIVGNSSLGKEFKSFNQLLGLIDSDAGMEIGRLFLNGIMLAFGKENKNQLLTEFFDDFRYKLSPDFADAMLDYKDFIKTVDLTMIPQTIELLFRKDELGNSLAQMPLGQLVDLIQPETSKYGIDVRSLINGIIGKGDSTFPDMVRKMMKSFNITNLVNTVTKTAIEGMNESTDQKDVGAVENKKPKKDQTLMLFKPMIAKLLRENDIDLDTDAVIQVLTPFIGGAGQYIQNIVPALKGNGKDFDLAQMLPLISLFSSQFLNNKNNKNNKEPDLLGAAMSLMGGLGKNNDVGSLLNLASQFLGDTKPKKSKKDTSVKEKEAKKIQEEEAPGLDVGSLMENIGSLANSFNSDGTGIDAKKVIELATNMLGGMAKSKEQEGAKPSPKSNDKATQKIKKKNALPEALGRFLLKIESDKKGNMKIKDAVALGKSYFYNGMPDLDILKEQLSSLLTTYKPGMDHDVDSLTRPLAFSMEEWSEFFKQLNNDVFRNIIISNTVKAATDLIAFVASEEFQKQQNESIKKNINNILASVGIKGLTINNFPDRLSPLVSMMSKGWDLPADIGGLMEPLKITLKETWAWYTEGMKDIRTISRDELEHRVALSLEDDVALPILALWRTSRETRSSAGCLPRAVCDLVQEVRLEKRDLKNVFTQLGSIIYGSVRGNKEEDFMLAVRVARAAVFDGECKEYFPNKCKPEVEESEQNIRSNKIEETHDEL